MKLDSSMKIDLIVIDGQNDFLADGTEPLDWPWPEGGRRRGALCVEGANKEAEATALLIDRLKDENCRNKHRINKIHATLDSHHLNDGSHNVSWKDGNTGKIIDPFTIITHKDVVDQKCIPIFKMGVWEGTPVTSREWALRYTKALDDKGRNPLCAWPPHCLIGEWGQCVYKPLMEAYHRWCETTGGWIDWVSKGQWPWTEHYSAIIADVPDPKRPETQMNVGLVKDVNTADIIIWTGWAGSHCLKFTGLDSVNYFEPTHEEKSKGAENLFVKKSVFFEDASAPVVSPDPSLTALFKEARDNFLNDMSNRGATITTTDKFLQSL